MRILLINYEYPPLGGGAANATMFLGHALADAGHEVTVLTSGAAGLAALETARGVRVVRLPALRRARHGSNTIEMGAFLACALARAKSVATQSGAQGVVAFFSLPCGPVAWRLGASLGLPYVVSLRGGDVPGFDAAVAWVHRLATPLRRTVLRGARAVIANSASLGALAERADPIRVQVIPNGVDTELFAPATTPGRAAGGPLRVVFVGRLTAQKNVELLLRELAGLGSAPARLDIVGDGPERSRLQALASRLGLADRVAWHGWRDKREIAGIHRDCDCLVNPSRFEGMPNAVLEAMAAGLPVVASDIGGNNELVRDGDTGYLFPLERDGALGERIARLAGDPARRRAMGERAREVAVRSHSWARAAEAYMALLQR